MATISHSEKELDMQDWVSSTSKATVIETQKEALCLRYIPSRVDLEVGTLVMAFTLVCISRFQVYSLADYLCSWI